MTEAMEIERELPMAVFGSREFENICLTDADMLDNHFPSYKHLAKGYMLLPPQLDNALPIVSLDCEFCKTTLGLEVIRVIVVDKGLNVIINELVKPKGDIIDFLTEVHGITAWELGRARFELLDIQKLLFTFCDQNTLFAGHGLDCDLKGLRIIHFRCTDVKVLFNCGGNSNLNFLSRNILHKEISSSADYAKASMMLSLLLNAQPPKRKNQGGFGSKQTLVTRVHSRLLAKYHTRLVIPLTTCLRGKDTLRIHCKKWDQLLHVEGLIEKVDNLVEFYQVCLPISMKTKRQKKGFFVYLKFYNLNHVQQAFDFISSTNLYKAELAQRGKNQRNS